MHSSPSVHTRRRFPFGSAHEVTALAIATRSPDVDAPSFAPGDPEPGLVSKWERTTTQRESGLPLRNSA